MGKYRQLVDRARQSAYYWAQYAMRNFVGDAMKRMDARNMSRVELAQALKVSPAYITKALRGDVNFTLETMSKIAHAVGGRIQIEIVDAAASDYMAHAECKFHPATRVANIMKDAKKFELPKCGNDGRFNKPPPALTVWENAA